MYSYDRLKYIINLRKDSIMKRAAMERREKDLLSNLTRLINQTILPQFPGQYIFANVLKK